MDNPFFVPTFYFGDSSAGGGAIAELDWYGAATRRVGSRFSFLLSFFFFIPWRFLLFHSGSGPWNAGMPRGQGRSTGRKRGVEVAGMESRADECM